MRTYERLLELLLEIKNVGCIQRIRNEGLPIHGI